ncbi:FliM/FliN family flagellar motor C-terminal domain-containing protein [Paracoccus sp. TOH]|uniref:FliM/FliN family flagellar motor C-terminal domain-containing protein n=1 Tax=Paracoccus simplex TaxID=2086346 RepID=A0ABV7RUS8_9RHOB|nr:FliM/FliN family flagellar motor C-terminal domain-containing protein [Paracoccus sp. TOH]WJS85435.1 FliM/FliN family flagellar motor C-terminal domain-containing protein [Paracoccus sp. TOH]
MDNAATARAARTDIGGTEPGTIAAAAPASVLRRWIAARERARVLPDTAGSRVTPEFRIERAVATALGRAAEKQARLPVFVEHVELAGMTLPELPEFLPERALLAIVEGRRDAIGVVAICPALLTSLIEMQAIGRVTARPAQPRKPTRTDATLAADFVNALLAELARECVSGGEGVPDFGTFRYATYMDDPRPLTLMLEDAPMSRLTLRFRIGAGGQRDAVLMIALPAETGPGLPRADSAKGAEATLPASAPPPAAPASLAGIVRDTPIRLAGILCRRKISLQQLRNLGPGSLIPLPQNVLDEARIETPLGQLLARGRLGEADGFHAIRLRDLAREAAHAPEIRQAAWETDGLALPGQPAAAATQRMATPPEPPLSDRDDPDAFRPDGPDPAAPPFRATG